MFFYWIFFVVWGVSNGVFYWNFFVVCGVSNGVRWLGAPVPKNGVLANLRSHQLFRCQISGLDCTARRPVCNLQFKVCNLLATPGFNFIATLPLLIILCNHTFAGPALHCDGDL